MLKAAISFFAFIPKLFSWFRDRQVRQQGADNQELEVRRQSDDDAENATKGADNALAEYRAKRLRERGGEQP